MSESTHRVAVNTIIMYIRMVFLMLISFFSSRLLLQALGVEDFGIQSVVGSVAATFISLKSLFSESVQRFLNYEKGKGSLAGQQMVFSIGVYVHFFLAIAFAFVVGLVGYWLIINKLAFPPEKINTAVFVFYMSLISMVIGILSVPFDALIIANEKMGIYAFVTIVDAILKLLAVLALPFLPFEMLRSYSVMLIAVPVFTLVYQYVYSRRFEECKLLPKIDKVVTKEIVSLSGWNFFGNISFSLIHEGVNMLLNVFGGLVFNASRTIAYSVRSYSGQLANNTFIAVRPRIMQQAASDNLEILFNNINTVSRISFFTMLLPVVMSFVYVEQLLDIWLVDVPEYAPSFTRLVLLAGVIRSLHEPLNMLYMAMGKIKRMMLIETFTMLLFLGIIYLSLSAGSPMWMAFAEMILMEALIIMGLVANGSNEFGFSIWLYLKKVVIPLLTALAGSGAICSLFFLLLKTNSPLLAIVYSCIIGFLYIVLAYTLFDEREKGVIQTLLHKKSSSLRD